MNEYNVIIRPAQKGDSELIAKVVAMAIGTDEDSDLYPVFLELAGREVAQYSYRNALVAEVDGRAVGAIVGYDGARLHELREPIYELLQKHLGKTIEIEEETADGEFYLDSLAVLPECRGLGVGRLLLSAMIERAFSEGHERAGLLVDFDNPRAEKLYASLGFERVDRTTFLGHDMWHLQVKK